MTRAHQRAIQRQLVLDLRASQDEIQPAAGEVLRKPRAD
jgi:hypothetical protein